MINNDVTTETKSIDFTDFEINSEQFIWLTDIDDAACRYFYNKFMELENDPNIKVIPVIINSFGGSVYEMLAIRDLIKASKKIVATVAFGKAMSAGASILAAGTKGYRFASPESIIMIHEMSNEMSGSTKTNDLVHEAKYSQALNNTLMRVLAEDMRKSMNYLTQEFRRRKNADWSMNAAAAKKAGLIDHVKVPRLLFDLPKTDNKLAKLPKKGNKS